MVNTNEKKFDDLLNALNKVESKPKGFILLSESKKAPIIIILKSDYPESWVPSIMDTAFDLNWSTFEVQSILICSNFQPNGINIIRKERF